MPAQILELIDKVDQSERVRDQIAAILLLESEKQQQLAVVAGKDPDLWRLRVFTDTANPIAEYESLQQQQDAVPAVNVWFDNSAIEQRSSGVVKEQKYTGVFNVDCYGCGISRAADAGHVAGDRVAAAEAMRAARLVRNILMAGHYTYLGLPRGVVARRWVQSIKVFQPQIENRQVHQVVGAQIALHVDFVETAPQVSGQPLEVIAIEIERKSTGEVLLTAQYGEEDDS